MRQYFRYFISTLWAVAFVLFAFTLETVADELGYTEKVRKIAAQGWFAMDSAGYSSWVFAIFMLLTGATLAVWIEYGLRRWDAKRKIENWCHVQLDFESAKVDIVKKLGADIVSVLDYGFYGRVYNSNSEPSKFVSTVIVVFEKDIENPGIYVSADRAIIWREIKATARQITIELDLIEKSDIAIAIIIRPDEWSPGWKQGSRLRWNDATVLEKSQILG